MIQISNWKSTSADHVLRISWGETQVTQLGRECSSDTQRKRSIHPCHRHHHHGKQKSTILSTVQETLQW